MAAEILCVIGTFITLVIFIVFFFRTRHRERLAMIQSGKDPYAHKLNNHTSIKTGLLALSIGLGLSIGYMIDQYLGSQPVGVFSCILIFGGTAMIVFPFIKDRFNNPQDNI